jgi:signal transduction histidine kinase
MSAELARPRDLRRQMTADIAHELRTPLSVILGQIDASMKGRPRRLSRSCAMRPRLGRSVEDLRTSLADAAELPPERRPWRRHAAGTALAAHRLALEKGIRLELEIQAGLPDLSSILIAWPMCWANY